MGLPPFLMATFRSLLYHCGNYSRAAQGQNKWGLIFIQSERNEATTHSAESKHGCKCRKHSNSEMDLCAHMCVHFSDSLCCCPDDHCHHFQIPTAYLMRYCPSSKVHLAHDVARLQRFPLFQELFGGPQENEGFAV